MGRMTKDRRDRARIARGMGRPRRADRSGGRDGGASAPSARRCGRGCGDAGVARRRMAGWGGRDGSGGGLPFASCERGDGGDDSEGRPLDQVDCFEGRARRLLLSAVAKTCAGGASEWLRCLPALSGGSRRRSRTRPRGSRGRRAAPTRSARACGIGSGLRPDLVTCWPEEPLPGGRDAIPRRRRSQRSGRGRDVAARAGRVGAARPWESAEVGVRETDAARLRPARRDGLRADMVQGGPTADP